MKPEPVDLLARCVVFRTCDLDEFHAYIASMEGRHDRQVLDRGAVEIELRRASLGRVEIALHHASVKIAVEITRKRSDDFLVQFPLSGSIDLEIDRREFSIGPGTAALLSPSQHVRRTGRPGWTLVFRIPPEQMRAHLESRLGRTARGDLVFHPRINDGAPELLAYALLVVEAIDRGAAPAGSSVARVLEDGFLDLLLELQPHSQGQRLHRTDRGSRAARVRALGEYVDAHLDRRVTIGQLARAASCSTRALQTTFTDLCGLSPMEYVQRRRLSAARVMLEAVDRTSSVSDVALACGFSHLARFAARYKARYGESPSETRRRVRAGRKDCAG